MPIDRSLRYKYQRETRKLFLFFIAVLALAIPIMVIRRILRRLAAANSQAALLLGLVILIYLLVVIFLTFRMRKKIFSVDFSQEYKKLSVVGIIRFKREKEGTLSLLAVAVVVPILSVFYFDDWMASKADNLLDILLTCILLLVLLVAHMKIFSYRVRRGYYGSNEEEAREIVRFILLSSEDVDSSNGGGKKSIFEEGELRKIQTKLDGALAGQPAKA